MIRGGRHPNATHTSLPRMRGDDPKENPTMHIIFRFAPHARG